MIWRGVVLCCVTLRGVMHYCVQLCDGVMVYVVMWYGVLFSYLQLCCCAVLCIAVLCDGVILCDCAAMSCYAWRCSYVVWCDVACYDMLLLCYLCACMLGRSVKLYCVLLCCIALFDVVM